jgi:multidrug resistance efflux pump
MSDIPPTTLEPDEQFIDALEQRLAEGIRRRARLDLDEPTSRLRWGKGARTLVAASLMLLSLLLGATGTFAVVYQDPAPQRELHVQKAGILLDRARVRLEQRQADLAELLPLIEQGRASETAAATYRQKVARAEAEVRRRELDLAETRITGRAPVDELTAPLVEGKDFVVQRLEKRHRALGSELQRARAGLDRVELLADRGMVSGRELGRARADLEQAEQALARVQERITLRRSFVNGEMTAEEAGSRALLRDAEAEHAVATARVRVAQMDLQRMTALHEGGRSTTRELRSAQAVARDAEADLAVAEVELKLIWQRLAVVAPPD